MPRRTLAIIAALLLPLLAARADKDEKKPAKYVRTGFAVGKVLSVNQSDRRLKIQVSFPVVSIDQNAVNQMNAAQVQMAQAQQRAQIAVARRDVNGLNQARQQANQAQQRAIQAASRIYKTKVVNRDVEVQAVEDAMIRTSRPKVDFDDKGEIKKYTKAELKELKGDPKLHGYKAEYSDLATGQVVRIILVRKAPPPRPKKDKDKKEEETPSETPPSDGLSNKYPLVSFIEILYDPPPK